MASGKAPSPIPELSDGEEDSTSSAYARAIKRIISRTQSVRRAPSPPVLLRPGRRANPNPGPELERHSLDGRFGGGQPWGVSRPHAGARSSLDSRSLYSLNEFPSTSNQVDGAGPERPPSSQQHHETSFVGGQFDQYELSSTDNQAFEFEMPSYALDDHSKPPPFARRYFVQGADQRRTLNAHSEQDYQDHHSGDQSDSSEHDLNTKWSWRSLKEEFKLSHSESLFHLYQAKLQHSFFVALLMLNIIFNAGAIISYAFSKYHEMNICK